MPCANHAKYGRRMPDDGPSILKRRGRAGPTAPQAASSRKSTTGGIRDAGDRIYRGICKRRKDSLSLPLPDGVVGMWSIQAPDRRTAESAGKDCPHAFHALRAAAANEKQPNDPKRPKYGMPSEFIIGSGRIGTGAASKRQNPHEPSKTRSRRDSTRILTSARYSC